MSYHRNTLCRAYTINNYVSSSVCVLVSSDEIHLSDVVLKTHRCVMRRPKASSESVGLVRTRTASQFSSYLSPLDRATANILIQPRGGDRFNHTPSACTPATLLFCIQRFLQPLSIGSGFQDKKNHLCKDHGYYFIYKRSILHLKTSRTVSFNHNIHPICYFRPVTFLL